MMVASAFSAATAATSKAMSAVTRSSAPATTATSSLRGGSTADEKPVTTPPPSSASKTRRRIVAIPTHGPATPPTNKSSNPSSSSPPTNHLGAGDHHEVLLAAEEARKGSNGATPASRLDRSPPKSSSPPSSSPIQTLTSARSDEKGGGQANHSTKKVDRFGFIQNMDANGNILHIDEDYDSTLMREPLGPSGGSGAQRTGRRNLSSSLDRPTTGTATTVPSGLLPYAEVQRSARREKKWEKMIETYYDRNRQPPRHILLRRCRKGLPHSIRSRVWKLLGNVNASIANHPGMYEDLVRKTVVSVSRNSNGRDATSPSPTPSPPASSSALSPLLPRSCSEPAVIADAEASVNGVDSSTSVIASTSDPTAPEPMNHTKSFRNLQDTIERDIHRTFPRHLLFYEESHTLEEVVEEEEPSLQIDLCGTTEISSMIRELELGQQQQLQGDAASEAALSNSDLVLSAQGGQASLRRVLKAYSLYDREIGYCQGMNFIAGMFLTLMSEEEAFWLLVAVMNNAPCKIRGLFGEGMRETHQVLHVAERLIQQFLPRLSKHLEREHIHITMFATQWLLTQYTSSFRFDLVTRVWDCFLAEGWKITYRVMLAILVQWQSEILKMTFEDILAFFRELPDRVDGNAIVDNAIKIPLRRKHIRRYEREWNARQQQQQPQQGARHK